MGISVPLLSEVAGIGTAGESTDYIFFYDDYMDMGWEPSKSQTRQNSNISSGVPSEMRR